MSNQKQLEEVLNSIGDLPAMPAVVSDVLRKAEEPDVDMDEISAIIEADPALTAKILQVSNSSYYGMKQFVGTLKLALVILGVREVRNIVLGVSVFEALKGSDTNMALAQQVWTESLQVAALSRRLAKEMDLGLQGEEFIAGLLADTGKMIILLYNGDSYTEIIQKYFSSPLELIQKEESLYGYNNGDASTALAAKWDLPEVLLDALWRQYPDDERKLNDASNPELAALIRIARAALTDDFELESGQASLEDLEAWTVLEGVKRPVAAENRRAILQEFVEEVKSGPTLPL